MTLDERIRRMRWCIDAIEAKAGAHHSGTLEVALVDARQLCDDARQASIELAVRLDRSRR